MPKLNDGQIQIELVRHKEEVIVSLTALQYQLDTLANFELFLKNQNRLLNAKVLTATEEILVIAYELPPSAVSITEALKNADLLKRVEIARKYSDLMQDDEFMMCYFIHPDNLFLISNQLYVAHCGLAGAIEPKETNDQNFLTQYKALVISTLNPKYDFTDLVTGLTTPKDKAYTNILIASSVTEITKILDEQFHTLNLVKTATQRSVKKSRDTTFKVLAIILSITLIGVGAWLGLLLENTIPRQNRIIEAHAAFMIDNFGEATAILSGDDPRTLPSSVQYMLATSHIELSTLTLNQRQIILNNLSPLSLENELVYWIYLGRGEILQALNLAYLLGDNQLILHAYANRYDYIFAHQTMPGIERQEALTHYRERLEELVELLDGRAEDLEMPTNETNENDENDETNETPESYYLDENNEEYENDETEEYDDEDEGDELDE